MVRIENLLGKPIWVRRNNGDSLNIVAGGMPMEVPAAEWETNPMLKKLEAQGAVRRREPSGGERKNKGKVERKKGKAAPAASRGTSAGSGEAQDDEPKAEKKG